MPYARIVVNHSQNCNMRCTWCHEEGMQSTSAKSELDVSAIVEVATKLFDTGIRKFKVVGGEPTLRQDLPELISGIRELGSCVDISMVSNGSRLASMAGIYKAAGLDRVNVSLFTLREDFFRTHVGRTTLMAKVDAGIRSASAQGILGKINHVYQSRDELLRVLDYAADLHARVNVLNVIPSLRSREGMPVGELLSILYTLPVEASRIEEDADSLPVTVLTLSNSVEIEVKHLELGEQDLFRSCSQCAVRDICKEGIFAVRVTPGGRIQPCIVRDDNTIDGVGSSVEEISNFLSVL